MSQLSRGENEEMSGCVSKHAGTLKRAGFILPFHNQEASRLPFSESGPVCPPRAEVSDFRFFCSYRISQKAAAVFKAALSGTQRPGCYWPDLHFDW